MNKRLLTVNIFQDFLTLEYEQEKLSRYSVEWQPDERHLARVGNPRFYRHPYQSPQQVIRGVPNQIPQRPGSGHFALREVSVHRWFLSFLSLLW